MASFSSEVVPGVTALLEVTAGSGNFQVMGKGNFSPPVFSSTTYAGTNTPATINQVLNVKVTDDGPPSTLSVFITVKYADGSTELVWDGHFFGSNFTLGSVSSSIDLGFSFDIQRTGGWHQNPLITTVAIDGDGNSSSIAHQYAFTPPAANPQAVLVSPSNGSTLLINTPLVVDVTDAGGDLDTVYLAINDADGGSALAYDGTFSPFFIAGSSRNVIANGFRFSLVRAGGWVHNPTLKIYSRDNANDQDIASFSWLYTPVVIPADNPPTIVVVTPAAGSNIHPSTPLVLDVTNTNHTSALTALLAASIPALSLYEIIHDGTSFAPLYSGSSRSVITDGFRYTVIRTGGWPASPSIVTYPVETS